MIIESKDNKKIKYISKLRNTKYMNEEEKFIIEGYHLVEEALKAGILIETISVSDTNYNVPNTLVSDSVMKHISTLPSTSQIIGICKFIQDKKIGNRVIILDNVQDPGNVGTIIRSAKAFNFDTVVLSNDSVNKYNEKLIRSTQGMLFNTNVITKNIQDIINELKDSNYLICTTDVNNGKHPSTIDNNKLAVIVGNEGTGVSNDINNLADTHIYIPTNNNVESLNVAVAASIIMYEINKE